MTRLIALALAVLVYAPAVMAQSHVRVGLADDPDVKSPATAAVIKAPGM